jgi:hypothetical protein
LTIVVALGTARSAWACLRFVRQPEAGQRHAGETDAEFLERRAARDRLGQAFGEFIEFVIHTFPFVLWFSVEILGSVVSKVFGYRAVQVA